MRLLQVQSIGYSTVHHEEVRIRGNSPKRVAEQPLLVTVTYIISAGVVRDTTDRTEERLNDGEVIFQTTQGTCPVVYILRCVAYDIDILLW